MKPWIWHWALCFFQNKKCFLLPFAVFNIYLQWVSESTFNFLEVACQLRASHSISQMVLIFYICMLILFHMINGPHYSNCRIGLQLSFAKASGSCILQWLVGPHSKYVLYLLCFVSSHRSIMRMEPNKAYHRLYSSYDIIGNGGSTFYTWFWMQGIPFIYYEHLSFILVMLCRSLSASELI